jgi:hypothetical protein
MATQKENRQQKMSALMLDVNSGELNKVKEALGGLKQYGDVSIIAPLFTLLHDTTDRQIHQEIHTFLADIHQPAAIDEFFNMLAITSKEVEKQTILNVVWNSKLNFSSKIKELIRYAVEGDFMTALECLTVLENLDGPFAEEDLIEAQLTLSSYTNHPTKSEQKDELISDIAIWLRDLEENLEG